MTETRSRTVAPAEGTAPPRNRSGRLLPALTVAAPLPVAVAVALHPDDTHGAAHALEHIAGDDRFLWIAVHLLESFGWLFLAAMLLLALPRLAPDRGRSLVSAGAVLAAIGYASLAFIVYSHGEAFLFMTATGMVPGDYTALFDQYQVGMPLAAIPVLGSKLGLVLASVGLLRARTVPRWAAALLVVTALIPLNGAALPLVLGLLVMFGPLVAALAGVAPRLAASGSRVLPTPEQHA